MSKKKNSFGQSDIVRLSDEDAAIELLERAVTGLWEVVNELTRFRRTTRQNYRVTIFGSARLKPGTPAYEGVKQLAAELTKMGCDIISGGGPGLMQAANEGALSVESVARKRSVGIRVELPFEQEINPFVGHAYEHRTFFSRLHHFMIVSDAFMVVPGGIGTLLDMSLAWQLLQVRKLFSHHNQRRVVKPRLSPHPAIPHFTAGATKDNTFRSVADAAFLSHKTALLS